MTFRYLPLGLMEGPTMGTNDKMPGDGRHANQITEPPQEEMMGEGSAIQKRDSGRPGRGPDDQARPADADRTQPLASASMGG